jgi:hypothetical protein
MVERRISDAKGSANHVLRGRYPAPLGEVLMKESVCRLAIFVGVSMISVTHHWAMAQADLPQAKVCSADDGGWSVPGGVASTGEIVMNNDGAAGLHRTSSLNAGY